MITISNLRLSFGDKTIFDGITWTIGEKSRIGLVGDNGTGKTTLLRVILGQVEPDEGTVDIQGRKNRSIGYLPQDLDELEPLPLLDYLKEKSGLSRDERVVRDCEESISRCAEQGEDGARLIDRYETALASFTAKGGYAFEAKARRILKGIGFREGDIEKKCTEFSGGWKMRILLALILLSEPDIMLLDEPVNHLDTESMEWLESYLKDYHGTIITIAHDRVFLDKITTRTAELLHGHLTLYHGNYSFYLKEKGRLLEARQKELLHRKAEIDKIHNFVERFRYKATKARQVQSRLRMLEKHVPLVEESKAKTVTIRFPNSPKSGKEVVTFRNVAKAYGDQQVFMGLSFTIYRGNRIALVGVNGAGKSTLSRLLSGTEDPTAGAVQYGLNVKIAFFSQESAENLDYEKTVWEEASTAGTRVSDVQRRNLLGAFLFSGDDVFKKVSVLSGGEKSRLALVKILLDEVNLLVLDEPTNHLDLKTKDIFQKALLDYPGTVVIVSHDRFFLDQLVDRVLELRDGSLHEYAGNYSSFIETRTERSKEESSKTVQLPAAETKARRSKEDRRREAEERNRISRIRFGLARELQAVERDISLLEARKAEAESLLCAPQTHRDPAKVKRLTRDVVEISRGLDALYAAWQAVVTKMEDQEQASSGNGYP